MKQAVNSMFIVGIDNVIADAIFSILDWTL